jgi:hypothetical protein
MKDLRQSRPPINPDPCAIATAISVPANCSQAPARLFDGNHETTPRIARLLGEFCSAAAMHTSDRNARQRLLTAAAEAFDAMSILERRRVGAA